MRGRTVEYRVRKNMGQVHPKKTVEKVRWETDLR